MGNLCCQELNGSVDFLSVHISLISTCSFLQGYGKADHSVTVELLKKVYTDYEITWSDDKK